MINDSRVCVCLWNDGTSGRNGESRIENEIESEIGWNEESTERSGCIDRGSRKGTGKKKEMK